MPILRAFSWEEWIPKKWAWIRRGGVGGGGNFVSRRTFFAKATNGSPRLFAAHDEIGVVLRHGGGMCAEERSEGKCGRKRKGGGGGGGDYSKGSQAKTGGGFAEEKVLRKFT
jgi:hypothetical protein